MSETKELTDAVVKNASCPEGKSQHYIRDSKQAGLALRLRSTGGKSFVVFVTRPGLRGSHKVTIGAADKITVTKARQEAGGTVWQSKRDDLIAKRREQKEAAREASKAKAVTVGKLIEVNGDYQKSLEARHYRNARMVMSTLRRNLLPAHKSTDIRKLERQHVTAAMDKLAAQGKLGAAADFRKHASTFLTWCCDTRGLVKYNVMHGYRAPALTREQKLAKRSKRRALANDEIKKVWQACSDFDTFGLLVRACLLTGARRIEPTYLKWSRHVRPEAVVFDAATMKAGRDHFTPRGRLLNAVLADAKTYRGTNDFVFPSVATGGRMGGFSRRIAKLIEAAATLPWTMHDLRRTTRTILSKCGWDDQHQRVFVGQSAPDLDQRYNMDERAEVRRMMMSDLDNYITAAIANKPTDIAVRQARAINPANKRRQELLTRLANLAAA